MKILFYQRSDVVESSGGTEKVLTFLSSEFAERGCDVVLMANEQKQGRPFFKLSEKVKFINIGGTSFKGIRNIIFKIIKSTFLLKRLGYFNNYKYTSDVVYDRIQDENPDIIVLASPSDLLELCYSHDYKSPIIQMIHNVPWNIFHRKSKRVLEETIRLMPKVKVCQVLMDSYVKLMEPYYRGKVAVIPNAVPQIGEDFNCSYDNSKEKLVIINIARITTVKNQKLLLGAFAKIADKYPKWEVNFWGGDDGSYRGELESLIRKYNLEGRVVFKGKTKEPLMELKNADIFAFPSIFEGFPLALTEAMAVGLPCIGLSTATSVNEIIVDGDNGILTENNENDFANGLEALINDDRLREKLGREAKKSMENYSSERIVNDWEKLLKETAYENS